MQIDPIDDRNGTPGGDDSTARKRCRMAEGAREALGDMTRILRALVAVRVDASTSAVLHLDERGRREYAWRLRRLEETLVELEKSMAHGARYFDEAATAFEAEGL